MRPTSPIRLKALCVFSVLSVTESERHTATPANGSVSTPHTGSTAPVQWPHTRIHFGNA
jgi:hypothetical protein